MWPFKSKNNSIDSDSWIADAVFGGLKSSSGISVTPMKALGVSSVLACVSVISKSIASLPIQIFETSADGSKSLATGHPLHELLSVSPTDGMTAYEAILAIQSNLTLRGNAYAMISRNGLGTVKSFAPIDPQDMQVGMENGKVTYTINNKPVQARRIIHFKSISQNGLIGQDTLSLASNSIGLAIAIQDDIGSFFANGSKVGSMLITDSNLNAKQVKELRDSFDARHKGSGNAHKSAILTNGLKPFIDRFSYSDSQLIEQRAYQTAEIARTFGVSLSKIQVENANPGANVTENNRDFVSSTLTPYIVNLEQRLNLSLLSASERSRYSIAFDMSALLRGNLSERYASYQVGRSMGVLSVNEIRAFENMNLIGEEGDTRIQPLNHTMLGNDEQTLESKTI